MAVAVQHDSEAQDGWLRAGPALVESEDFGFLMANLYPRETGLPMTVWAGPHAGARHDERVKVCMIPGDVMRADQLATVAVRPEPKLLHGQLTTANFALVAAWIALDRVAIISYWDGELGTGEFTTALRRL